MSAADRASSPAGRAAGWRPLHRASRNADLGLLHETFFICAVTTILCIRTDLWLTHYPQLGGHGLHIAHLLYGGALMLLALAFLLTLLAFIIVSCGVVRLRRRYPHLERPFKVPALPLVAAAAILSSLALMATLPGATWIRLAVWALLGFCVYFFYARANSAKKLAEHAAAPSPSPAEVGL